MANESRLGRLVFGDAPARLAAIRFVVRHGWARARFGAVAYKEV